MQQDRVKGNKSREALKAFVRRSGDDLEAEKYENMLTFVFL